MEKYVLDNILLLPNGITPIACKQAHGAVVLCVAQSNRYKNYNFKIYHLL